MKMLRIYENCRHIDVVVVEFSLVSLVGKRREMESFISSWIVKQWIKFFVDGGGAASMAHK